MATAAASQPVAQHMPRHVAIIMDGNGRWAAQRHLPRAAGHRAGVEAVRAVTRAARAMGVQALTLYAFSSENWRRPAEEVSGLMGLLKFFIRNDLAELVRENVRLRVIGDYRRFPADVVALVDDALAASFQRRFVLLQQNHMEACVQRANRDAGAHGAGADDGDALHHARRGLQLGGQTCGFTLGSELMAQRRGVLGGLLVHTGA